MTEQTSLVPKRRFKEFSNSPAWEQRKLSDIATMKARIGWQGLTQKEFLDEGDYYLITGTDFNNGTIDFSQCHYISKDRYEQDSNIQIKNDDVLITKDGTIGKVAYIEGLDKPGTLNAGVFVIRGREKNISNLYLYHYLAAPFLLDYADKQATGGTIKHLNQNVLVGFPVPLPSVEEQQKIGESLTSLDHLITLQQRKLEKTKALKSAYLSELFPAEGELVPKRRFAGFTDAWEQHKVKDICEISTGKSNTQDKIEDGIYPFYVRSPIIERSNRYLYDEEAVLTVGDGVGTGKVYHYVNGKYDLHQRVYRMFDFKNGMIAKYFYHHFSNHFYNRVMAMTAKTSVDSVRYEMISEMDIEMPSEEEQAKIIDFLDNLDHLITLHQRKLEKLQNIKKAYLNEMFV